MFKLADKIMKKGYVDEHGHKLYGAAALAHYMNMPVSSLDPKTIEAGKKFVDKLLRKESSQNKI